ncbi:GNAT family N-acetyltransferase [bacterium]|nr:GNAT family N-acetyltransferase [bacterium]
MICKLSQEDIEQVVGIFAQHPKDFNPLGIKKLKEELEEYAEESQSLEIKGFFVEKELSQVIGLIGYVMRPSNEYEITWLAVRKDWQRRGIGRKLLEYVEQSLKSFRSEWLWLEVPNDPATMNFYSAMGFSEETPLELSGRNKVIYRKKILAFKPTFKAGISRDGLWR